MSRSAAPQGILVRTLENEHIRAEVSPSAGGKFISLVNKATGTEWILPPLRPYTETRTDGGFEHWDGGGFDECLPTVAAAGHAPDHGELWRHAWREEPAGPGEARLHAVVMSGSLALTRTARLEGAALVLEYAIRNTGAAPLTLLYSAHPLLHVQPGDRILLPAAVKQLVVEGSMPGGLGPQGTAVTWPVTAAGVDLSQVGPPDGAQADKLFAGPLRQGWCALLRPAGREGIELRFDTAVLPYLGLWICRAAWPDSGTAKQYAVAFEPASAPTDSIAVAARTGAAWTLAPAETRAWSLRFRVATQARIEAALIEENAR